MHVNNKLIRFINQVIHKNILVPIFRQVIALLIDRKIFKEHEFECMFFKQVQNPSHVPIYIRARLGVMKFTQLVGIRCNYNEAYSKREKIQSEE